MNKVYPQRKDEVIDAETSRLMSVLFNMLTEEAKNAVTPEDKVKIGDFMHCNGYRAPFTRWYLQAETCLSRPRPKEEG